MSFSQPHFSEFHAVSAFSFLRGSSHPEAMVARAAALGYRSIAITDQGGFYGSARAHYAARECGIRAVVGTAITLPDGSLLPALCATRNGYRTMSRHLTDLHLGSSTAPGFTAGDVIVLTGDRDGPVIRHLVLDRKEQALAALRRLVELYGQRNVYVEIHRHRRRDDAKINRYLIDLAEHFRLPLLASNAPVFAVHPDRMLADAFTCLRNHTSLDHAGRLLEINSDRYLRSLREMAELFRDLPQALVNCQELDQRIDFTLENLGYEFPDFPGRDGKPLSLDEQMSVLWDFTFSGARSRWPTITPQIRRQLEHELAMIARLGFPGYFLVVNEIVEYARSRGILCQGRGSAANSAVCFALGITAVDPVGRGLLFERFLSENRKSWPDIDIDFPSGDRREDVIQHVFRKYGERGAAMTANVITYRPKSAFREMSKVLGFAPAVADRFSQVGGDFRAEGSKPAEKADYAAEFAARIAAIMPPEHPRLKPLAHLYQAVLSMPRHLGQHSGGMIVCSSGLDAVVPLQRATMPGRTVVQWDKDDCEDLGLVKIDLLGLGMLAAMEDALVVCKRRGKPVDLAQIPKDDTAVFDLMCCADTVGTFQVESRAQMATLPIMRPRTFYDVAIEVAIIRPGPIVGDLVHPYLNRRRGREAVDYMHPACEPILNRTLGVPLFQEQMLRIAMDVAGFTGAEADELRRAMAFKRSEEKIIRISEKLRSRMNERQISPEVQEKIVASIGSFALYGFPESHAISFALIAYASCWLKVHRTAEFYCGLINNQPMGFYSVHTLIQDGKRRGLRFLPVSVVHSDAQTDVMDDQTLRLGLRRLKGLSAATIDRMVMERSRRPFNSLDDFRGRVRPNDSERRMLAKAGALNDLPQVQHRRDALWHSELPLFNDLLSKRSQEAAVLPPMSIDERLAADYSIQGASTGPHPMSLWRQRTGSKILRARDLHIMPPGMPIQIGGLVICRQRPGTAKGHCFISLEDETGIANLFVPQKTFEELRLVIVTEPFLLAHGRVQISEGDQPTVYVTNVEPLPGVNAQHVADSHDFH